MKKVTQPLQKCDYPQCTYKNAMTLVSCRPRDSAAGDPTCDWFSAQGTAL
jgi:hypothetical protein